MGSCRIVQREKSERVLNKYGNYYTVPPSEKTLKKLMKVLKEQKLKYFVEYTEKEIVVSWENRKGFFK